MSRDLPRASAASDQLDDFTRRRVPAQLLLGEQEQAVYHDLEHASRRLDQLNVGVRECLTKLGRQTGGPRLVVSNDAVFDRHSHGVNISGA